MGEETVSTCGLRPPRRHARVPVPQPLAWPRQQHLQPPGPHRLRPPPRTFRSATAPVAWSPRFQPVRARSSGNLSCPEPRKTLCRARQKNAAAAAKGRRTGLCTPVNHITKAQA